MINKFFLVLSLSLIPSLPAMSSDPQRMLYEAICAEDIANAQFALEKLKANPTFIMPIEGTRTVKQINALNFALYVYYAYNNDSLLRIILKELTHISLQPIPDYQDQVEGKTPQEIITELFPEKDVHVWLNTYTKRRKGSVDAGL